GFAPTPYDSGESTREQGISRAGNKRLQAISIQLAWNWGALATDERADAVVSGAVRDGEARAPDWHCGGRAQARDRAVAVCHDRGGPRGRDPERRVGSNRCTHARCAQLRRVA